jgi:predicted HTH domain antitoxin
MQMRIDYPDTLPDLLQTTPREFEAEARMAMAVKLFELKRLSSGLAARLAGVTRVEFLLGLHRYGVPVISHDDAELALDLAHA